MAAKDVVILDAIELKGANIQTASLSAANLDGNRMRIPFDKASVMIR